MRPQIGPVCGLSVAMLPVNAPGHARRLIGLDL